MQFIYDQISYAVALWTSKSNVVYWRTKQKLTIAVPFDDNIRRLHTFVITRDKTLFNPNETYDVSLLEWFWQQFKIDGLTYHRQLCTRHQRKKFKRVKRLETHFSSRHYFSTLPIKRTLPLKTFQSTSSLIDSIEFNNEDLSQERWAKQWVNLIILSKHSKQSWFNNYWASLIWIMRLFSAEQSFPRKITLTHYELIAQ